MSPSNQSAAAVPALQLTTIYQRDSILKLDFRSSPLPLAPTNPLLISALGSPNVPPIPTRTNLDSCAGLCSDAIIWKRNSVKLHCNCLHRKSLVAPGANYRHRLPCKHPVHIHTYRSPSSLPVRPPMRNPFSRALGVGPTMRSWQQGSLAEPDYLPVPPPSTGFPVPRRHRQRMLMPPKGKVRWVSRPLLVRILIFAVPSLFRSRPSQ